MLASQIELLASRCRTSAQSHSLVESEEGVLDVRALNWFFGLHWIRGVLFGENQKRTPMKENDDTHSPAMSYASSFISVTLSPVR